MQGRFRFHGRLCRSDKRPANPGLYHLQFQLHGQPRDSQRDKIYWEEVIEKVEVVPGGFYRVILGQTSEVDPAIFSRGVRWMSVRVVRGGKLDEEHGIRVPMVGHAFRLYSSLGKLGARLEEVEARAQELASSSPKVDQFQTRVNRIVEALEGVHARLVPLEAATELNAAVIRRVETLTSRLDAIDLDGGDWITLSLSSRTSSDQTATSWTSTSMDRLEGGPPELIKKLRAREKRGTEPLELGPLKQRVDVLQTKLEALGDSLGKAVAKKQASSTPESDGSGTGAVKRSGDVMTGGLTINRGWSGCTERWGDLPRGSGHHAGGLNLIKAPKMLADALELRGDLTVDSATRAMQVRFLEGRQASARRDGALHLDGRGGAEVVIGKAEAAKGADVHGSVRATSLVAHAVGGVAQCFHATGNLSSGDVVRVNDTGERVVRVRKLSDARVMGVITDEPGLLLGGVARTGVVVVAVTGVWSSARSRPTIHPSRLATFSSRALRPATPVWSTRPRRAPSLGRLSHRSQRVRVSSLFCSVAANGWSDAGVGRAPQGPVPRGRSQHVHAAWEHPRLVPMGGEGETPRYRPWSRSWWRCSRAPRTSCSRTTCLRAFNSLTSRCRSGAWSRSNARRAIEGEAPIDAFPSSPAHVLPMIERLVTDRSQRVAVVLDFFETIVPMSDLSYMGEADKANLVAMQRWASDPGLLGSDNLVVLITEHLSDVHRRVVGSAQPGHPEDRTP